MVRCSHLASSFFCFFSPFGAGNIFLAVLSLKDIVCAVKKHIYIKFNNNNKSNKEITKQQYLASCCFEYLCHLGKFELNEESRRKLVVQVPLATCGTIDWISASHFSCMVGYYLVDRAIHQVVVGVPHQSFLCHLDHRNMTEAIVIINWSIIMVGSCTCTCIDYKHLLRLCSPYVVLKFSLQHHWRTEITKKKVSTKRIFKGLKSVQTFVLSIDVA